MKIKKFLFLILAIFITSCNNQYGDLNLPSVFSDHMVLQQKSNVSFWGESNLNDKITISASWGETLSTKADNNGKWQLSLATPKAGGPYSIEVKNERQSIVFNDVLIGEVWLASGQSNMGMILSDGIENQEEEIKNANFNDIRFFSVLEDLTGESIKQQKWVKTNPKNAAKKPRFDLVRKPIFLSSKSSKAIASHTDAPTLKRASLQVMGEFVSATNKHHHDQPKR